MIKKSALNSFSQYHVTKIELAKLLTLLESSPLYSVYRRF